MKKSKSVLSKLAKVFLYTLLIIFIIISSGYIILTNKPQLVVGLIQKAMYKDSSPNTFEPLHTPYEGLKENGQYLISEIKYSESYPNSYLNIIYPDGSFDSSRPTLFYFHGGGFFGGSKDMGDPLASDESTFLIDDIVSSGFNVVNVDYALVPDYLFPTPLIQANEAFDFIIKNAEKYHLNTDNIIIMGSSAGAIITAQYACLASNPDYSKLLNITPTLQVNQIKAVVIDDAPLDYENFSLGTKMLVGNYVSGTIYLKDEEINKYNPIPHITSNMPKTFMLGSEYRSDMLLLHNALDKAGVTNELVDPLVENGIEKPHCFISSLRSDDISASAFKRIINFLISSCE